jgi:hypothetical protein
VAISVPVKAVKAILTGIKGIQGIQGIGTVQKPKAKRQKKGII